MSETKSIVPGVSRAKAPVAPKKKSQPLIRGTRDISDKKIAFKKEGPSQRRPAATTGSEFEDRNAATSNDGTRPNNRTKGRRPNSKQDSGKGGQRVVSEYEERVLDIARVTTVVKGGRRFSFSAFVIIGNRKGKVGYGHGKANEVPDAIKKAVRNAQNNLITVPIADKHTIPHDVTGKFLASKVLIKPAPRGKGIIASGTIRAVAELVGYTNVYAKSYGSRSKMNTAKAALEALAKLRTPEEIATLRDVSVESLKTLKA